jgi:HNH endonuclease
LPKHPPNCYHCEVVRRPRPNRRTAAGARFAAKVRRSESGCLLWGGAIRGDGYGAFWDGTRYLGVHRYAWEMANGRAVPLGLYVLHHCDTPLCVEPSHLWIGTAADNSADMVRKGRSSRCIDRLRRSDGVFA